MRDRRLAAAEHVAAHHASVGGGAQRIPYPVGLRTLQVLRREQLTERIVRLTLGGPEAAGFISRHSEDHVALVLPDPLAPEEALRLPQPTEDLDLRWPSPMPPARKYTVRRHDQAAGEIDLDVVLHDGGIASPWARAVAVGDDVVVTGPPGAVAWPDTYAHYVLVVDPTGLPAAERWLRERAKGAPWNLVVVTDEPSDADYPLPERDGGAVCHVPTETDLAALMGELAQPEGTFLFGAGEASLVRPLRTWARRGKVESYVAAYWRRGQAGAAD